MPSKFTEITEQSGTQPITITKTEYNPLQFQIQLYLAVGLFILCLWAGYKTLKI